MQNYSYDLTIRDESGNVRKEYREPVAPLMRIPGVRDVVWVASIGRHVKM